MLLLTSVWRLSVAYIGPKSKTERPRKNKIGTGVAHVTHDSGTTFRVKRSKVKVTRPLYSPRPYRVRQLQRWAWERIVRVKLLLRCGVIGGARRFGAHRGEGRGISWWPPAYSLCIFRLLQLDLHLALYVTVIRFWPGMLMMSADKPDDVCSGTR